MAEDIWAQDEDTVIAHIENQLSSLYSSTLYHVHMTVHRMLQLPNLPASMLQDAYHTSKLPTFAKAEDFRIEALSRAAKIFDGLRHRKIQKARDASNLARAVTEKWFAEGHLETASEKAVVRAFLYGHIRAKQKDPQAAQQSLAQLRSQILSPHEDRQLDFVQEKAFEHCVRMKDTTMHVLSEALLDHLLDGKPTLAFAQRLVADFGTLNRDSRRLAITEVSFARSNGFLSGLADGDQVEFSAAKDACTHCLKQQGKRFTVRQEEGNWDTEVWVGKNNVRRRFNRMKRTGQARSDEEMAKPTIPMHPNCRCRWIRVLKGNPQTSRVDAALAYLATLD